MTDSQQNAKIAADQTEHPAPGNETGPFRLRSTPPRVVRLSRKMLAGLAVVASLGIGGTLIFALQSRQGPQGSGELFTTQNRQTADELQHLPTDYSGIPKLGPALPGDLGRPILSSRDEGRPIPAQPFPGPDPEEQRRLAELEAARLSQLFFSSQNHANTANPSQQNALFAAQPPGQPAQTISDNQQTFLNAPIDRHTVSADRVTPPASPYILQAGSIISAALVTGIRSDLPGQITAQVTENVYDSPSGRYLLIPQGARLIGQYDHNTNFGQRRVLLVWNRLILPDGRSIVLERQPGADRQGFAGLEDGIDHHWWDLAKAAALSTLLNVGAELASDDSNRLISAIRDGAQDTINDAGQQIVRRQLSIKPTLTIRPGFPVRVIVTRDLILKPLEG